MPENPHSSPNQKTTSQGAEKSAPAPDPETLSQALREDLAAGRTWETLAGLQGKLRVLAIVLVVLALLGLMAVFLLQGIVNSLEPAPELQSGEEAPAEPGS